MPGGTEGRLSPFGRRLVLIALLGLALRLLYVILVRPHDVIVSPDGVNFHYGANILARGHGFIDPYQFLGRGVADPAADHPPAYLLYLAGFSVLGFTSILAHMIASTFVGAATIVVVGLAGREVGGPTVGLAAAATAALYPGLIAIDGLLQAESMAVLAVTTLIYAVLRYRKRPTVWGALVLGLVVGWAAISRSEQLLLGLVVLVPLIFRTGPTSRERLGWLAAAGAGCLIVTLPWVVLNTIRFDRPVPMTTNLNYTIAATNCRDTWFGARIGFWSSGCAVRALLDRGLTFSSGDQTIRGAAFRDAGFQYLASHRSRIPLVAGARVLRMFSLWDPARQIRIDDEIEGREYWMAAATVGGFYVLSAFALYGAAHLKSRRQLTAELIGPLVVVTVIAVLFMGNTRYRSPAEGALCLLAGVGVVRFVEHPRVRSWRERVSPRRLTPDLTHVRT